MTAALLLIVYGVTVFATRSALLSVAVRLAVPADGRDRLLWAAWVCAVAWPVTAAVVLILPLESLRRLAERIAHHPIQVKERR